jgi:zinc protease
MSKRLLAGTLWVLGMPGLAQGQEPAAQAAVTMASTIEAQPPASPPAPEPPPPPGEAEPVRFTLQNGLRVVLQPDPARPRVAITVAFGVGSRDEPAGYQGLAHLTEHAMFEGTAAPGHADFHEWLAAAGVTQSNGLTSDDHTVYYEELPSAQLGLGLWLEAMRMGHLLSWLDEAMVGRARAAVLHEVEGNRGGCGSACLRGFQVAALYPEGHPYRLPLELGKDVEVTELAHVQWFFQQWYGPDNATLAVVGDFEPQAAQARIEALFGPIQRTGKAPHRVAPAPVVLEGQHVLTVKRWSKTPVCAQVWPVAASTSRREERALDLLANHLDRALSRLSLDQSALRSADSSFSEGELGGEFQVSWAMEEDADQAQVEAEVQALLRTVRSELLSGRDLARARAPFQRRALFARESLVDRSIELAQSERGGEHFSHAEIAAQYGAVTAEEVRDAARRWLPEDRLVSLCTVYADNAPRLGKVKRRRFVAARKAP